MKLPINWLKDYIEVPSDLSVLMTKLTAIGHMQDGPAKEYGEDTVYDLEIRQNRSDCLSILGLAQEASAVLDVPVKMPAMGDESYQKLPSSVEIKIRNPELCYRFQAVKIEGVNVKPSPTWMKERLEAYGVKSINNVVDITNFVMIELGEPMHAYDARVIEGAVSIRLADKGEKLVLLGGKELALTQQDLVITDDKKVLGLAGIMGGEHSGIKPDTTSIILEDATYNQASIRRSSIRHSLRTEASTRHEKFLHPHLTTVALQRAISLILSLCGGTLTSFTDAYPTPKKEQKVNLSLSQLEKLGGVSFTLDEASTILKKLGFATKKIAEGELEAVVPYWRTDIIQEADVIEEVLRIYGYDNLPASLPSVPPPVDIQSKSSYALEEQIRDIMIGAGYDEQITEPLTNEKNSVLTPIVLQNSLNADKTMLRTTLKNSLVSSLVNQQKYRKEDIRLFELGKIYFKKDEEYKEEKVLATISSFKGNSFSKAKGVLEVVVQSVGYEVQESILKIEAIDANTFYAEIVIKDLLALKKLHHTAHVFTNPPQVILQDISLKAPAEAKVGEIMNKVQASSKLIYKIRLGEDPQPLDDGTKSIFLRMTFYSTEKTLSMEDVEPVKKILTEMLQKEFGISLR